MATRIRKMLGKLVGLLAKARVHNRQTADEGEPDHHATCPGAEAGRSYEAVGETA